jgi:hypothetical protein
MKTMMNTALKTTAAALALGLSLPAMAATDGQLGTTSTGTMNVTLHVAPNTNDFVQILGLEDITLNAVKDSAFSDGEVTNQFVCFNKNSPGQLQISASVSSELQPSQLGKDIQIVVINPDGITGPTLHNTPSAVINSSPAGCNVNSGQGAAHGLYIEVNGLRFLEVGTRTGTITLTIAAI